MSADARPQDALQDAPDITAVGRTIPGDKIGIKHLSPNAYGEWQDWYAALQAGPGLGVGETHAAAWIFCIFTDVLPAQDHIAYRSVRLNQWTVEQFGEMVRAGAAVMRILLRQLTEAAEEAEKAQGAEGNAEAAEPKPRARSKRSKPTGDAAA